MRRSIVPVLAALVLGMAPSAAAEPFPDLISLPEGFAPEGIAVGKGATFYAGSIPSGAVVRGDLRTGEVDTLVSPSGRAAIGLATDAKGRVWVAGGPTGEAYVYDGRTGETLAVYELTDAEQVFINDVVVTRDAAWLTDSFNPVLYRIPLGAGGSLGAVAQPVPLAGDYRHGGGFNLNGIDATPDGGMLLAVQSSPGSLYAIEPSTGVATLVDLGGDAVPNGDGILLDGRDLYVVQNRLNRIAAIRLSPDLTSGVIAAVIVNGDFDVPTTIAEHGGALYAVNARFGTPVTPDTEYHVVRVPKA